MYVVFFVQFYIFNLHVYILDLKIKAYKTDVYYKSRIVLCRN